VRRLKRCGLLIAEIYDAVEIVLGPGFLNDTDIGVLGQVPRMDFFPLHPQQIRTFLGLSASSTFSAFVAKKY
jgi:hypothetical protein